MVWPFLLYANWQVVICLSLIWYFLFYSALGFLLEVVYTRCTGGAKRDRKCMLFLPLCPVYGVGALGILALPGWVLARPAALFPAAALVAAGAEYLLAAYYQRAWGVSFWDYTGQPLALQGRICLPFALAWGLLSLPLVYWVHPLARQWGQLLPGGVIAGLGAAFLADLVCTGQVLRRSHSTRSLRWWVTAPPAER